jgi:hypothetical protein
MDPLSITASVIGILTAAGNVVSVLSRVKDAPKLIADILAEVKHIQIIFKVLQNFLERTTRPTSQRAALIQLDDVVVILTQTVLVFSELETLVRPLVAQEQSNGAMPKLSRWRRVTWAWQQPAALRLVNQLQQHKVSLSLMLQIIQWSGA